MFSFFQDYLSLIVEYLSVLLEVNFPPVLGFQCKSLSKWDSVPLFLHPFPVCWFCCCLSPTLCPSLRTRSWLEVQAPVLVDVENNADVLPGLGAVCSLLLLQISGFITAVTPAAFMEAFSVSFHRESALCPASVVQCHGPELLRSTCTLAAASKRMPFSAGSAPGFSLFLNRRPVASAPVASLLLFRVSYFSCL